MSKLRLILLSMLAVFAFSAVASSAALAAPEWTLNGKVITKTEKVTYKLKSGTEAVLKDATLGVAIKCTALKGKSAQVEVAGKDKGITVFEGCKVNIEKCEVVKGEVKTETLTTKLAEEGTETIDIFEPPASKTFAVIKLKGTGCPLTSARVTGSVSSVIQPPLHGTTVTTTFPGPKTALELAGSPATFEATVEVAYEAGGEIGVT
jgi:hypothetical protein